MTLKEMYMYTFVFQISAFMVRPLDQFCQEDLLVMFSVPSDLEAEVQKVHQTFCDVNFDALINNELNGLLPTELMVCTCTSDLNIL